MVLVNWKLNTAMDSKQIKVKYALRFKRNPALEPSVNAILVSNTASECSMSYLFIFKLLLIKNMSTTNNMAYNWKALLLSNPDNKRLHGLLKDTFDEASFLYDLYKTSTVNEVSHFKF